MPAHNEPPELVIQTLRSLSRLHRTHYEVLVMVRLAPPDPATCLPGHPEKPLVPGRRRATNLCRI